MVTSIAIQKNDVVQNNGVESYQLGAVPVDISGGFGRISGIVDSEDNLSHPPGFSNIGAYDGFSDKSFNNGSFLVKLKKNDIEKAMGFNLGGCLKQVNDIVEGSGVKRGLK